MATQAWCRAFLAQLVACGVQHVAVSPGSRSTPMTVAADRTDGLELTMHLDERSGGFFALGLARATRRPVAVLCTSGTAAANYLPAVIEAFHSGVPLLVLTTDRPPELLGVGAPQAIDQVALYGTHTRWAANVATAGSEAPGEAASLAHQAVVRATRQAPGPVHSSPRPRTRHRSACFPCRRSTPRSSRDRSPGYWTPSGACWSPDPWISMIGAWKPLPNSHAVPAGRYSQTRHPGCAAARTLRRPRW
jgi:hypothetical protein